ncbi:MAG: hypothetical protein AAF519_09470 [Bacteroidota bacterium]
MTNKSQYSLFDEYEAVKNPKTTDVVKSFSVKADKEDSPSLKRLKNNFNNRLKTIKKLKEEIEGLPAVFASLNELYGQEVKGTEDVLNAVRYDVMEGLDQLFERKSLSNSNKMEVSSLIVEQMTALNEAGCGYDDKYLKYTKLPDFSSESDDYREAIEDMVKGMMGLDEVDLEDILGEKRLNPEEFAEKYQSQIDEKIHEEEKRDYELKKQKLDRDIQSGFQDHFMKTYKSLAKKIHPDLEKDEHVKKEKEAIMQELAQAKDNKDLFQLIAIKLKIEKIENGNAAIDERHLQEYAERLLEQKKELERHIFMMKHHSGWNSWLYQNFYAKHKKTTITHLKNHAQDLLEEIDELERLKLAAKSVKKIQLYLKERQEEESFPSFMDTFYFRSG